MLQPMKAQTPLAVSKTLLKLLQPVSTKPEPFFLEVNPLPGATPLDCFANVGQAMQQFGGTRQMGWLIHVWPRVLVELQDHAIWIQENGLPRDPTPTLPHCPGASAETVQLFLPDPTRSTLAPDIKNIQLAFPDHPANEELAEARMAFNNAYRNQNETAIQQLGAAIIQLENQRNWQPDRNDPCPCGSRSKFKNCHGR